MLQGGEVSVGRGDQWHSCMVCELVDLYFDLTKDLSWYSLGIVKTVCVLGLSVVLDGMGCRVAVAVVYARFRPLDNPSIMPGYLQIM